MILSRFLKGGGGGGGPSFKNSAISRALRWWKWIRSRFLILFEKLMLSTIIESLLFPKYIDTKLNL